MSDIKIKFLSSGNAKKFSIVFLIFSVSLIYFQSLWFDFVWDDIPFLKENELIRTLKNIPLFFTSGMPTIQAPIHYRPITMMSLAVDYFIWKDNPFGYHLTNLIFHIGTTILIYFLLSEFIINSFVAVLSSLIFALHPIHCDAVCWIMARADIICGFFLLLSFLLYLKEKLVISIIFFIVALFAKEMAVTFPLIVFLYGYFLKKNKRTALKTSVLYLLPVVIYLMLRSYILEMPFGEKQSFDLRFVTSFTLVVEYLKNVFYPFNLKLLYHGLPIYESFFHKEVIFSIVIVMLLILSAIVIKKKEPLAAFSVFFFFVSLFPVSGLPTLIDVSMIADRYLYIPVIGVTILFARLSEILIEKDVINKRYIYVVICLVAILLSSLTMKRKFFWEDEFVFLTKMTEDAPYYHEAKAVLAYHYVQRGDLDEAERLLKLALKIKPDYAEGLNTLGSVYLRKGNYELATVYFSKAIYYNPIHPEAHSNLAIIYAINKKYEDAEREFKTAIKLKPNFIKAYLNLARMYIEQRRFNEAEDCIANSLRLGNNEEAKKLLLLLKERQR